MNKHNTVQTYAAFKQDYNRSYLPHMVSRAANTNAYK